ncbi:EpsD family peptidyl-prolyl cis-trans isomerase [Methylomonas sp. AM2-LC]|uniref:EpsD family peptidyl-prolyl cis-trans isomerase n=1 Tax=Methylomonas sp. AM2-LC TaxID=3153301 RepID=UPI00326530D9
MQNKSVVIFLILFCVLSISGCGKKNTDKKSGQIVAKVDNDEVSIHQINLALSQSKDINKNNLEAAKTQVAKGLVEQSLVYQQAVADGLDREPQVMLVIEQTKRQILAQAWLEKKSQNGIKPSTEEIQKYYEDHPELFAKHKTYKIKEVTINKTDDKENKINQIISENKKLDLLLSQLDAEKLAYKENIGVQPAENIPLDKLSEISKLIDGEYIVFDKGAYVLLVSVMASSENPVEKNKAYPIIETYLVNLERKKAIEKVVENLKAKAKIEYLGDYSALNSDQQIKAPAKVIEESGSDNKSKDDVINKGVKGL